MAFLINEFEAPGRLDDGAKLMSNFFAMARNSGVNDQVSTLWGPFRALTPITTNIYLVPAPISISLAQPKNLLPIFSLVPGKRTDVRELGKLERTFFTLQWLQDPELRRRSHVGLNKGEQQNALRPAGAWSVSSKSSKGPRRWCCLGVTRPKARTLLRWLRPEL
jgi:hypothetical protein